MTKHVDITTHQFKLALVRKLKNLVPDCEVEWIECDSGLGFVLVDGRGRRRSNLIRFHRYSDDLLTKHRLTLAIIRAGMPEGGSPDGLQR